VNTIRARLRTFQESEDGFTLIEMLLVSAILGIIVLPLGAFMIAYFSNLTKTLNRVSVSHDMQIAAAYFSQDVANLGTRLYDPASGGDKVAGVTQPSVWAIGQSAFPPSYCGRTAPGTVLVLFEWDTISASLSGSPPATTTQRQVDSAAYVVEAGTLHRIFCSGTPVGGSAVALPGTTAKADAILVHNLVYPDPGTSVACSSTCASSTWPTSVTLNLSLQARGDASITPAVLSGDRRQGQ